MLNNGERLEDLYCNGLKIIQNANGYCFTSDSVILANYVKAKKSDKIVELCAGGGVISILLSAKTPFNKIIAVELQAGLAELAKRNVELNNLTQKIEVKNISLQNAPNKLGKNAFDVVVCNPPYTKNPHEKNLNEEICIARHEICMTLKELIISAKDLLNYGGKFYFVHRAERLDEIMDLLKQNEFTPKEISFVYPKQNKDAYLVMIKAVKNAKGGVKVLPPIYN